MAKLFVSTSAVFAVLYVLASAPWWGKAWAVLAVIAWIGSLEWHTKPPPFTQDIRE